MKLQRSKSRALKKNMGRVKKLGKRNISLQFSFMRKKFQIEKVMTISFNSPKIVGKVEF